MHDKGASGLERRGGRLTTARIRASSNIVVLDPEIAQAFPNAQAVNDALRGLLELAKTSARLIPQST